MAISPQLPENSREIAEKHKLTFEVLSDQGNRVAQQFGLMFKVPNDVKEIYGKFGIDLEKVNGDGSWTLPMPARFVIDRTGTVRAANADPDYTTRPEPAQTVEALKALKV